MATQTEDGRAVQGGPAQPVYLINQVLPAAPDGGDVDVTSLPAYTSNPSGEVQGVTSATRLPDVAGRLAVLKARATNIGNVYIGASGVTIPNNVTDTTSGIEIGPGESVVLPIANLNQLYRICDTTSDVLTYMVLA